MWNLPRPDTGRTRDDLDLVFPPNNEPPLATQHEKDSVLALYQTYDNAGGRPGENLEGGHIADAIHDAILAAYGWVQESRKLAKLRSDLKLAAEKCPYCGIGEVHELDHHLVKAVYKIFSIFPLNLIPCDLPPEFRLPSVSG
jgi:hypothetical protein